MRRLVTTACALVCLLAIGWVQSDSNSYFTGIISNLNIRSAHAETPYSHTSPQICILDPVAHAAETVEKPLIAGATSPSVEIPETSHDFGTISDERELVHNFSIRNVGKSVLNIKKVVPG